MDTQTKVWEANAYHEGTRGLRETRDLIIPKRLRSLLKDKDSSPPF